VRTSVPGSGEQGSLLYRYVKQGASVAGAALVPEAAEKKRLYIEQQTEIALLPGSAA